MRHVLVVEDDWEVRESVLEALQDNGHPAQGAADGRQALEKLRAQPLPCLIVLDLMMPIMDGRAFREQQLRDPVLAKVPVVVVSAYPRQPGDATLLQPSAWLNKPINLAELLRHVEEHCADA
jgi:CheY-like chemotaxis protein